MSFFEWKKELETGNGVIDTQHKSLVQLVNNLYKAHQKAEGQLVLEVTIDELLKYTNYHFTAEEDAMEKGGYPELSQHKKIHKTITEQLISFKKEFDQGTGGMEDFLIFLKDWLYHHIEIVDMDYKGYVSDDIYNDLKKL
jgi:hemerythrin-like metal-binding protein